MADPATPSSMDEVRATWDHLGSRDPMWAVLSDPDKRGGRWDVDEFFATGEQHIAAVIADLESRGLAERRDRALDFGCGLGRLTQPLADHYGRADGVDVARSMVEQARLLNRRGDRCRFHLNEAADLELFETGTFDLVFSFIVLQHIPPELTRGYLGELARVARPGATLLFQLPSEPRPAEPARPLPAQARRAELELEADPPAVLDPGQQVALAVRVTNTGSRRWPARVEGAGPFQVRVGNHWRSRPWLPRLRGSGGGRVVVMDDGRVDLPLDVDAGQTIAVRLNVTAPRHSGRVVLEIDMVQEQAGWFAQSGSPTLRVPVSVRWTRAGLMAALARGPRDIARRVPVLRRLARAVRERSRAAAETERAAATVTDDELFSMNGVPRPEVEAILETAGCRVVDVREDGCAGGHWISYTYTAVKGPDGAGSNPG